MCGFGIHLEERPHRFDRLRYSAHQPKVLKEYIDLENQTWVDNPNFHADGD